MTGENRIIREKNKKWENRKIEKNFSQKPRKHQISKLPNHFSILKTGKTLSLQGKTWENINLRSGKSGKS
jgi:hypothetical protein